MPTERAAFFFGSGISRSSGAAGVPQITDALLNGNWACTHLSRYIPARLSDEKSARVQQLFRRIETAIGARLRANGQVCNYEHLYSAVRQLEQDVRDEIVNPLIADFDSRLRGSIGDLVSKHKPGLGSDAYTSLLADARKLIQWVVFNELSRSAKPVGLEAVSHVAQRANTTNIFTLNHDTLVEAELADKGIDFSDGFKHDLDDVWVFNAQWNSRANVYKLHGSLNWYRGELPDFDQYLRPKMGKDPDHLKVDGRYINLYDDGEPLFLTGTMVKEQAYTVDLVGDMFCKFRHVLTTHRRLVVCGYGWQDRTINLKLQQWLRDQTTNRMLILHNDPTDDISRNQFWASRWDRFSRSHLPKVPYVRTRIENRWLSECTGDDLIAFFNEPN